MPWTISSLREFLEESHLEGLRYVLEPHFPGIILTTHPEYVGREGERSRGKCEASPEGLVCPRSQAISYDGDFGLKNPTGWYPYHKSCVEYFIEHGQYTQIVQSVSAYINICLPCQRPQNVPVQGHPTIPSVSLRPYIRRLIITALDSSLVMRAFFGDHWVVGVSCIHKQERTNYLFMAKSSGWGATKTAYDILPNETAPFVKPLYEPSEDEIRAAEAQWSEWLAMEDWMVGARSPW